MSKLNHASQSVLDELLAQLENRKEALRGIEATTTVKELVYRRGEFVVKNVREEKQTLDDEQKLEDLENLYELLTSSKYSLEELPGDRHSAIRIRAKPAHLGKFNPMNPQPEDHQAAILTINQTPVRLLEARLFLVNLPWWIDWLIKSFEAKVEFEYLRGVPVPRKSFSRVQSKGLGVWRFGGGDEIEVQYKE